MKTLRKPTNLLLAATLTATLFVSLPAAASSTELGGRMHAMTEGDLGQVCAQGLSEDLLRQAMDNDGATKGSGLRVIGKVESTMNSRTNFLNAETTLTDIVYDPARAKSMVTADGSLLQAMPSSIGEISFDNIRIKGDPAAPAFGSISIRGIDLGSTTLTLTPRH